MEDLEVLKRKIEEKFASSDAKRIVPEMVLMCIKRLDEISKRLDDLESKILNSSPKTHVELSNSFLKEVNLSKIKENLNADTNS